MNRSAWSLSRDARPSCGRHGGGGGWQDNREGGCVLACRICYNIHRLIDALTNSTHLSIHAHQSISVVVELLFK